MLWLSFQSSTFGRAATFVGLTNYAKILGDPYFWRALANTVAVVLVVVHVELVLGLAMALLFASGLPLRKFLIAAVLAPYAVSEVGAVVMWRTLFDPDTGLMTRILSGDRPAAAGMGGDAEPWPRARGAPQRSGCTSPSPSSSCTPPGSLIPKELFEAARVDGASAWQTLPRVTTLPLLVPAMLVAMLFRYIFAFRLFSEVWLLTQGGPARSTEVVAVYLYLEAFRYNDFGAAAATGWIMVVTSLLLASIYLRTLYRDMFARAATDRLRTLYREMFARAD